MSVRQQQNPTAYKPIVYGVIFKAIAVQARLDEAVEERRKARGDAEALKSQSKVSHMPCVV